MYMLTQRRHHRRRRSEEALTRNTRKLTRNAFYLRTPFMASDYYEVVESAVVGGRSRPHSISNKTGIPLVWLELSSTQMQRPHDDVAAAVAADSMAAYKCVFVCECVEAVSLWRAKPFEMMKRRSQT